MKRKKPDDEEKSDNAWTLKDIVRDLMALQPTMVADGWNAQITVHGSGITLAFSRHPLVVQHGIGVQFASEPPVYLGPVDPRRLEVEGYACEQPVTHEQAKFKVREVVTRGRGGPRYLVAGYWKNGQVLIGLARAGEDDFADDIDEFEPEWPANLLKVGKRAPAKRRKAAKRKTAKRARSK